jgi:hypothetical protein
MLERLAQDLARAAEVVDATRPVARNKRSGVPFEPGLGPHSEFDTFNRLMTAAAPQWYLAVETGVPTPPHFARNAISVSQQLPARSWSRASCSASKR